MCKDTRIAVDFLGNDMFSPGCREAAKWDNREAWRHPGCQRLVLCYFGAEDRRRRRKFSGLLFLMYYAV